jgi:hypothetical protein
MLVTVAMLVIIMTILVQIFRAATGAVSAAQAFQQIDDQLRRVDGLIRSDLEGVTARFTPPLDPAQNLGYFEYGENEFADAQGEDSDDYIRFTAKAPAGRPFTGRMFVPPTAAMVNNPAPQLNQYMLNQPVTITSEYAEIIYFLRNGNLYRRVLLVAPELQSSITPAINNLGYVNDPANPNSTFNFMPGALGGPNNIVSWQGVNDISAHPAPTGPNFASVAQGTLPQAQRTIILNTLGDLTNRENRFASPRFADDFATIVAGTVGPPPTPTTFTDNVPDSLSDDRNSDNVPDYYPTIYPGVFAPTNLAGQLIYEPFYPNVPRPNLALMGFPFIFPGAYSMAQSLPNATDKAGWIHAPAPVANVPQGGGNGAATSFDSNALGYLQSMNHNPLDLGDNLPTPLNPATFAQGNGAQMNQTWWGFPTWRETLSPNWSDPTWQVNVPRGGNPGTQPNGLAPLAAGQVAAGQCVFLADGVTVNPNLLPPMTSLFTFGNGAQMKLRTADQLFTDAAGGSTVFLLDQAGNANPALWGASWEGDLIMTNVRSFDVKAYDNALAAYADLGWGDDVRSRGWASVPFNTAFVNAAPFLTGNPDFSYLWTGNMPNATAFFPPQMQIQNLFVKYVNDSFAHEGRMPPLVEDNRLDYQYPNPTYVGLSQPFSQSFVPQYPNITDGAGDTFSFAAYSSNIGDDSPGVVRMRRIWDSWSTAYSRAPANGIYNNPTPPPPVDPLNGSPWGPSGNTPPIYPSYPPPYPAALRGIQIQIRVTDPTNQRIKTITIRQDFTDKL